MNNQYNNNIIEIKKEIFNKTNMIKLLKEQHLQTFNNDLMNNIDNLIKHLNDDLYYLNEIALKSDIIKKYPTTFANGTRAENRFKEFCDKKNIKAVKTDKATDIRFKTDFFIFKNNKKISLDVKAIKKNSRNSFNDCSIQYLEFQNVYGKKGTIYSNVDIIAFEQEKSFILVNKKSLLLYAEELKQNSKIVYDVKDSLYNLYNRKNNKDLVMKVYIKDILENCECSIWNEN